MSSWSKTTSKSWTYVLILREPFREKRGAEGHCIQGPEHGDMHWETEDLHKYNSPICSPVAVEIFKHVMNMPWFSLTGAPWWVWDLKLKGDDAVGLPLVKLLVPWEFAAGKLHLVLVSLQDGDRRWIGMWCISTIQAYIGQVKGGIYGYTQKTRGPTQRLWGWLKIRTIAHARIYASTVHTLELTTVLVTVLRILPNLAHIVARVGEKLFLTTSSQDSEIMEEFQTNPIY